MEPGGHTVLENMKDYLMNSIKLAFEVVPEKAERLYEELIECTRHKNMVCYKINLII